MEAFVLNLVPKPNSFSNWGTRAQLARLTQGVGNSSVHQPYCRMRVFKMGRRYGYYCASIVSTAIVGEENSRT